MELVRMVGIVMIVLSVLLLLRSFLAYAKHKLTENFGMIWGLAALCFLVTGILLLVMKQNSTALLVIAVIFGVLLIVSLFGLSQAVSVLIMKNQELAMQVSLLNQENESILQELMTVKEQNAHE